MSWTIYCIAHIATGRRYVGQTRYTLAQRWANHVQTSRRSGAKRSFLANAIRKYGPPAFAREVLASCASQEHANVEERRWIEKLDTQNPARGFNRMPGGAPLEFVSKKNPWDNPEYARFMREKVIPENAARMRDPAHRAKLDVAKATPESKAKSSASRRALFEGPGREKMLGNLKAARSKIDRAAHARQGAALAERWKDPEYRERVLAARRKPKGETHDHAG